MQKECRYIGLLDEKGEVCGSIKLEFEMDNSIDDKQLLRDMSENKDLYSDVFNTEVKNLKLLTKEEYENED
ncbi:MAG: hypothetical protein ACRC41_07975 [Sarcina sp.]